MRYFILFLCLMQVYYAQAAMRNAVFIPLEGSCRLPDEYPPDVLLPQAINRKVTLFCTEVRKQNGGCVYFKQKPEETLFDATVAVARANYGYIKGTCSGTVIKLTQNGKACDKLLLLTAGHCVDLSEMSTKTVTAFNYKGAYYFDLEQIQDLQKPKDKYGRNNCISGDDGLNDNKNCLVTPQEILKDDPTLNYSGIDQALLPIDGNTRHKNGRVPGYEIDIDKLSTGSELTRCFENKIEATVTASLRRDHFPKTSGEVPTKSEDLIRKDTCQHLSWMGEKNPETIKKYMLHDCPSLRGLSGSLITVPCGRKKGIFVHRGQRFGGISDKEVEKARAGRSMEFDPENRSFVNTATHISPELLRLFSDKYCGFDI